MMKSDRQSVADTNTKDPGSAENVCDLSFAEATGELEQIISQLDAGLVDVDVLEVMFRRAIDIVEDLDRRIHQARAEVDALMPRLGAIGSERMPVEPDLGGRSPGSNSYSSAPKSVANTANDSDEEPF